MSTPLGHMQWKLVPIRAKNGNTSFQRMMEDLLQPVRDSADPFVDDIIIGLGTEDMTDNELTEAHEKDLLRASGVLDKHSMLCKPTKASSFVRVRWTCGWARATPTNAREIGSTTQLGKTPNYQ